MYKKLLSIAGLLGIILLVYLAFSFRHSNFFIVNQEAKDIDSVEERALKMELPPVGKVLCQEAQDIVKKAFKKVEKCSYHEALEILMLGLQKYPNNFILQSQFASVLGDLAETHCSDVLKDRMIAKSKELFEKLMHELQGQPQIEVFRFKNEYFYRFAQYKNQYENGKERVTYYWNKPEWDAKVYGGYYCQGVGAAHYAKELILQRKKQEGREYAQKALVAWAQYFSYENDYYNAYVHYALALGILGYKDEMMRALQHSASLIKKDLSYREFTEVTDFIKMAEEKRYL